MKVLFSGIDFPHENGEFGERKAFDHFSVFSFTTPFLYEKNGKLRKGNAGDVLIHRPGDIVYHGPRSDEESFTNDWIFIKGADFKKLLKDYPLPTGTRIPLSRQRIIHSSIEKIKSEQALKYSGYETKINCILTEMMIELFRLYRKSILQTPEARIEAARDTIMQALEKPWTLKEMANLCGYSPSRFSAIYSARFGCSPKSDLIEARFETAKQMLLYSGLSISNIADCCGFQSIYYFSKYFKLRTGLSPSEFAGRL